MSIKTSYAVSFLLAVSLGFNAWLNVKLVELNDLLQERIVYNLAYTDAACPKRKRAKE